MVNIYRLVYAKMFNGGVGVVFRVDPTSTQALMLNNSADGPVPLDESHRKSDRYRPNALHTT